MTARETAQERAERFADEMNLAGKYDIDAVRELLLSYGRKIREECAQYLEECGSGFDKDTAAVGLALMLAARKIRALEVK